jgi:Protein of unknown function (DUF3040)
MNLPGEGDELAAIERRLVDDDPALAEAFRRWEAPARTCATWRGETTAPPWVLAVFLTATVVWIATSSFGVAVGVLALSWVLFEVIDRRARRPGTAGTADAGAQADSDRRDDGGLPPHPWLPGWR